MGALVWVRRIFALIGAGMLVGTWLLIQHTRDFVDRAETVPGVVIDLVYSRSSDSSVYKPAVRFTAVDGREVEFVSSTGSNPAAYDVGEAVEVLYDPMAPHDASINSFFELWLGPLIVGILGSVFGAIGFGMIWYAWRSEKLKAFLQQSGMEVEGKVSGIERNTSLTVNGRNPWRIAAQWHDPITNQMHLFYSENIWFDPTEFVTQPLIRVLVDRTNPKKYWMDIGFLPKEA